MTCSNLPFAIIPTLITAQSVSAQIVLKCGMKRTAECRNTSPAMSSVAGFTGVPVPLVYQAEQAPSFIYEDRNWLVQQLMDFTG